MVPRVHPFQYSRDRTRRACQDNCSCRLTLSSDEFAAAPEMAPRHPLTIAGLDGADCRTAQSSSVATSRSAPTKLLSILRCINQNRCLLLVSRFCGNVIAV